MAYSNSQLGRFFMKKHIFESMSKIPTENIFFEFQEVTYVDHSTQQFKMPGLSLKVTSHRLIFAHEKNGIYFVIAYEQMRSFIQRYYVNFCCLRTNNIREIVLNMTDESQSVSIEGDSFVLKQVNNYLNEAWDKYQHQFQQQTQVSPAKSRMQQPNNQMYGGAHQIQQQQRLELQNQEQKFQLSFKDQSLEGLSMHVEELKNLIEDIKANVQEFQQSSETDKMLQEMGQFNIITKEDVGDKQFLNEIGGQIHQIFQNLFECYGGVIPILDLFFLFNKKRGGLNLVSSKEFLQACQNIEKQSQYQIKITQFDNGIKVLESTNYDQKAQFEKDIGQYIDQNGITPEQLSKKLTQKLAQQNKPGEVSVFVSQIKLDRALQTGQLVIDNRIEGKKYYKNSILSGIF